MKNVKVENTSTVKDKLLWSVIGLGVVLLWVINYYASFHSSAIRWIAMISGWLVLTLLFFFTAQGKRFNGFLHASRAELRKVVWPTRQETLRTTLLVVVMVVIAGLFLWAVDSLLLWMVSFLTK
jgi:preprotein translocase subunit SecE